MSPKFIEILNKIKPEIIENPTVDLVEEGILDSLVIMDLIAQLESTFDIDFDLNDVVSETFASAESIWAIIQKYENEKTK